MSDLKLLYMRIRVLTPVNISSGEPLPPIVYKRGSRLLIFEDSLFFQVFPPRIALEKLSTAFKTEENLQKAVKEVVSQREKDLEDFVLEELEVEEHPLDKLRQARMLARSPIPYIPGSSVKGCLADSRVIQDFSDFLPKNEKPPKIVKANKLCEALVTKNSCPNSDKHHKYLCGKLNNIFLETFQKTSEFLNSFTVSDSQHFLNSLERTDKRVKQHLEETRERFQNAFSYPKRKSNEYYLLLGSSVGKDFRCLKETRPSKTFSVAQEDGKFVPFGLVAVSVSSQAGEELQEAENRYLENCKTLLEKKLLKDIRKQVKSLKAKKKAKKRKKDMLDFLDQKINA